MPAADRIVATILGCGSSGGVPRIGNVWGDCDPDEPRNRRLRCSLLLEGFSPGSDTPTRIVIDTGCDLREQMLAARVDRLDAVLYTHAHADHTHGIDDLRVLALHNHRRVDVYFDAETGARLREAFGYCFVSTPPNPSEVLASSYVRDVIRSLLDSVDYVIIDTAPLLPVADGSEVAALADGTLLVARHGITTDANVQRSVQTLRRVDAKLIGVVLNRMPIRRNSREYGYTYYRTEEPSRSLQQGKSDDGRRRARRASAAPTDATKEGNRT